MRTLAILFTLFYFLNALAVAPYGFKGQSQSQTLYSNVLQAPNQLVTNLGGINALMETGNKNILANPSFEAPLVSFAAPSWSSLGFLTNNITPPVSGQKAIQVTMTASALSLHQDSGVNNAAYGDGLQCLASVYVRTTLSGIFVSPRLNNVTSTSNMVSVVPNGKWALYKVPFICSTGTNGIAIHSNSVAVTGTVDVDDAFVGAVDLQASVDASKIAGESYFNETASCTWSRTNTALGPFTATAACPGPSITYSSMGQWQTTDSDLPRQTINNLPAGTYEVFAIMPVVTNSGASATSRVQITDGTTQCQGSASTWGATSTLGGVASCTFTYNSSGNRTFEIYASNTTGQIQLNNTASSVKFIVKYFGNSSVYSSTNADTDWASCGLTGAAFTGFGSSVPTPSLQCKRQGSDLLIKGTFTTGTTPTAVEARMALPTWNGVQLVSAGSSVIPSLQSAGKGNGASASGTTYFGGLSILIEPSVSYLTFGAETSSVNGTTKLQGAQIASSSALATINARIPIEGWQGSNIIVGSFNGLQNCTSTLACTDTFSAAVSSAGVVLNENVDWINGNCTTAVSGINTDYTCSYVTGLVTQPMNCVSVDTSSVTNPNATRIFTSTSSQFQGSNATGRGITVICQKQGADYVGKTAMAVASDQNVRSIGSTGVDIQSVFFGLGADCSTVCTTGTCNICNKVGTKITSVTWNSTGIYLLNGIDGLKYNCSGSANTGSVLSAFSHARQVSTVSYAAMETSANIRNGSIQCIGIP